jgi:hypothetical protein
VGGVVGGIVVLGVLGLVLFFCLKRRNNLDDFDGNFDPDRVVGHSTGGGTLPQIDLGAEVTPFEYGGPGLRPLSGDGMTQYGESPYVGMAPSHRSMSPPSQYPASSTEQPLFNQGQQQRSGPGTGSETSGSHYGPSSYGGDGVAAAAGGAVGGIYGHSPNSSISQPQSAKEREAMTQRYGRSGVLGLATQQEEDGGQSSGPRESVVVHSDGGRVNLEEEGPTEIPPAYDSIPADRH